MTEASGSFEVASWQEDTYEETGEGKGLTQADVTLTFSGEIEGDASVRWLMAYRPDGTADFVGLARVTGMLRGRPGSFVLTNTGAFDGTVARGTWSVVEGSGTADLEGLTGTGGFEAGHQDASYTLDYELG